MASNKKNAEQVKAQVARIIGRDSSQLSDLFGKTFSTFVGDIAGQVARLQVVKQTRSFLKLRIYNAQTQQSLVITRRTGREFIVSLLAPLTLRTEPLASVHQREAAIVEQSARRAHRAQSNLENWNCRRFAS